MRINWGVRIRNPYFWIGLIAVVLSAVGIQPESLTSWGMVKEQIISLVQNPFGIACAVIAIIGYVNDPTTKGLSDSAKAMTYDRPAE